MLQKADNGTKRVGQMLAGSLGSSGMLPHCVPSLEPSICLLSFASASGPLGTTRLVVWPHSADIPQKEGLVGEAGLPCRKRHQEVQVNQFSVELGHKGSLREILEQRGISY